MPNLSCENSFYLHEKKNHEYYYQFLPELFIQFKCFSFLITIAATFYLLFLFISFYFRVFLT